MKEIASPTTTKYILDKYNLFPKKQYGQNFVIDKNIIDKIIISAKLDKSCAVIEVGPGIGALTQILSKTVGLVKAYEIDQRFEPVYQEFLNKENVEIVFNDFLKIDLSALLELKEKYSRLVVVANLPYYITTQIIEKIVLETDFIDEIIVMVQKEVAKKYTNDYHSPLLLTIQDRGTLKYLFTVSKTVFTPRPHVDSAILQIKLLKKTDKKLYQLMVCAFKQKRKTIYNNLKPEYPNILNILKQLNINPQTRCEKLTLNDYQKITSLL